MIKVPFNCKRKILVIFFFLYCYYAHYCIHRYYPIEIYIIIYNIIQFTVFEVQREHIKIIYNIHSRFLLICLEN